VQTAKTQPRTEALVAIRDRPTTASGPYAVPVRELCGGRSETMSATRRAATAASCAAHAWGTESPPASSSAVSSDAFRLRLTDATVTIQQALLSSRSTSSPYPSGVVPCQTLITTYTSPPRASSQRPHCVRRSAAASTAAPPRPAARERWLKRERVKVRPHDEPRLPAERPGRKCRPGKLAFGACDISRQRRRRAKEDIDADERPRPPTCSEPLRDTIMCRVTFEARVDERADDPQRMSLQHPPWPRRLPRPRDENDRTLWPECSHRPLRETPRFVEVRDS
jgi:hypothetical protein